MKICVYGSAIDTIPTPYLEAAKKLGEILAQKGHTTIFGGGNHGVMGYLARGVVANKGELIGIAPKFFDKSDILFPECTSFIFTETMRERKHKMEELADAFIVAPGGIGTFEEFFETYTLRQLEQHTKPIILLNIDGYYDHLISTIDRAVKEIFLTPKTRSLFEIFGTCEEAIAYLET